MMNFPFSLKYLVPPPASDGRERKRERLRSRADGLDHATVILLADADVEEYTEPDAEDVEVEIAHPLARRFAVAFGKVPSELRSSVHFAPRSECACP